MNKKNSYYIQSWKKHTANQLLLNAIPNFEKVFGKDLHTIEYEEGLDRYKKKCLHLKFEEKNSYINFLNKLVEGKVHFEIAKLLYTIKQNIKDQKPLKLQKAINNFIDVLSKDPTLISIIPFEIVVSIKKVQNKASVPGNVIYLTSKHAFSCYSCDKVVSGTNCVLVKCICSSRMYHPLCASTIAKHCFICGSYRLFNNLSEKKKKYGETGTNTITSRSITNRSKKIISFEQGTTNEPYEFTGYKGNFVTNNATMQHDELRG